jgi:tetratricopeptide (TPR) repeat protein
MKRIAILLAVIGCSMSPGALARQMNAVLTRTDGRSFRVVLEGCDSAQLTYRLENGRESKTLPLADVRRLQIELPKLNLKKLSTRLAAAEYSEVISSLEPVAGGAGEYMPLPNNAVSAFALLTKALLRNGDLEAARKAAEQLQAVSEPDLKEWARAVVAQSVLESGKLQQAGELIDQLSDPAARLYLTARIQRARGQSKEAMQTVIELISSHPNDLNWMPQTEYLCAQLYLDLEMPDSALETARQTAALYSGSEFRIEAQKLQQEISQLTEPSGQAE